MNAQRQATKSGSIIDSVVVDPRWDAWETAIENRNGSRAAHADRAMLGLEIDRSVVMSGHQPIVFHPGIASKLAALMIACERTNSQAVWIVPDQDAVDPLALRTPIGRGGTLSERTIRLGAMTHPSVAAASLPAVKQIGKDDLPTELLTLRERLLDHANEPTLARQAALATIELATDWLGVDTPRIVFASELMETIGVREIVSAMTSDPARAISAYNNAVRAHEDAGVRELRIEDDRVELPLWRVRDGASRQAVFSDEIESIPERELLPRGLIMTGGARNTLGELFIHGKGGWKYDQITEQWINEMLGESIAPMTLVSATQRLELLDESGAIDPDRAVWNAQHAKHDPAMLGDQQRADEKRSLVERIERVKQSGDDPSALFARLQGLLSDYRAQYAAQLDKLETIAQEAQRSRASYTLAMDRTWPFVHFDAESGLMLTERVRSMMR